MGVASIILASSDQRGGQRVPTFLRVRLRFASVDNFIEKYSTNVSMGGIFIQSRSPKPPGTTLRFEMALENGDPLIRGEGQVTWVREFDPNSPGQPFGMGVRFTHLDPQSRAVVERAVAHRQETVSASARGFATSPPTPQPRRRRVQPAAAVVESDSPPAERSRNGSVDLQRIDAQLAELMREVGITEERLRQVARGAVQIARSAEGDLAGLLRPPGTPPPIPVPGAPTGGTPPPGAGSRLPGTPPPLPPRAASPPPAPAVEPPSPSKKRKGRKRRTRATPRPRAQDPTLAPAEEVSGSIEIDAEAADAEAVAEEVSGPIEIEVEAAEPTAEEEVSAPIEIDAEAPEEAEAALGEFGSGATGEQSEAPEALFDKDDLDGAALMLDSLEQPSLSDEEAGEAPGPDITAAWEESPGVREPPTYGGIPGQGTDASPEREVATPPPEATGPPFDAEAGSSEPSDAVAEPPPVSARDRWAAATGPETANLEEELDGAMDSVIEPTPPPVATGRSGKRSTGGVNQAGKKGILGRIFKKKK